MATKKRSSKNQNQKKGQRAAEVSAAKKHIASVIMFAVAILLFLAAIIEGENAWLAIHNFILGSFGFLGYIVPIALGVTAVLLALDKLKGKVLAKIVELFTLMFFIASIVHIIGIAPDSADYGESIVAAWKAGYRSTGVFGSLLGFPLYAWFKNPGAWIICALLIFVDFMLMTGTTLIALFKALSKPVKEIEKAAENAYEQVISNRKPTAADIDIPLDDELPAESARKRKTSIEEKKNDVVNIYRELDNDDLDDSAEDKKEKIEDVVSRSIAQKAEEDSDMVDIIDKVNSEAENTAETKFQAPNGSNIEIKAPQEYRYPPVSLLSEPKQESAKNISEELESTATLLVNTLRSFGVESRIINISRGPSVTRYELQPAAGVKISKITNLADDIALNLATAGVRIEAPIPNKPAVGIEVPNKANSIVKIREIIDSQVFSSAKSKISVALGRDITGEQRITDISKMPHGLIAGATGSGKSVCINSIIMSILFKASPEEVKLLLIDPKVVELGIYNGIPHLIVPVVTDPRKAAGALGWAVLEMEKRYKLFAENDVRNISGYNDLAERREDLEKLPQIVIIIDELADLMMTSPGEVEDSICRLAQKARAAGMYMIVATQRPSVDVVTGLIKANIPTRIAFAVSSMVDSRTILDVGGAEKLMGKGDMLFLPTGAIKPERIQGCFVSDEEVEKVVNFLKGDRTQSYDEEVMNEIERQAAKEKAAKSGMPEDAVEDDGDPMLNEAIECVIDAGQASTSLLQRKLRLGYARAARIVDQMEERGVVGPYEGSKPRQVLMTKEQYLEMKAGQSDGE